MVPDAGVLKLQALTESAIAHLQQRMERSLFPLPLSPMEKFLWWDDSPEHPLDNFIELEFDGPLDSAAMQAALQIAAHLHPLLSCRIGGFANGWYWLYSPDHRPQLYRATSETDTTVDGRVRFIDLTKQPGLLAWHFSAASGDQLLFQFHHACCDGNGFRRVLLDLLSIYVALLGELSAVEESSSDDVGRLLEAVLKRWEPELLRERFDFSEVWRGPARQPLTTWQRIKNAHYFHFQLPQSLTGESQQRLGENGQTKRDHGAFLKQVIGRELTQQIEQFCHASGVRLNELALALLFQTCARWHREHLGAKGKRRIRLLMPFALMSRADLRMPAANRLSFSFLGRLDGECDDPLQLLGGIQQEIQAIRDTRLPMDFLFALGAASRWPRLMRWGIRQSRRMCTAVLSYGGDIARGRGHSLPTIDGQLVVGECRLVRVFGAPPVRSNTHIALGFCISGGELCFAQAWSRSGLSENDARCFLQMYVDAWRNYELFAARH